MSLFGNEEFSNEEKVTIRRLLEQKLSNEHLANRPGANGMKFTYVESWKVIELANSIFGFNGWSSSIVDITPDFMEEVGGKFRVGVTAVVRVSLKDGTFHEDVGYGISENKNKGNAIENAKKEAVSDARKRALRLFGNALGNCIYDKEHINRVKNKVKSASSSTVSYDQLRLAVDPSPPDPEPSSTSNSTYSNQLLSSEQQQQQQQQQTIQSSLNGQPLLPVSVNHQTEDEIDDVLLNVTEESTFQTPCQQVSNSETKQTEPSGFQPNNVNTKQFTNPSTQFTTTGMTSNRSLNGFVSQPQTQTFHSRPASTLESVPLDKRRRLQ